MNAATSHQKSIFKSDRQQSHPSQQREVIFDAAQYFKDGSSLDQAKHEGVSIKKTHSIITEVELHKSVDAPAKMDPERDHSTSSQEAGRLNDSMLRKSTVRFDKSPIKLDKTQQQIQKI